MGNCQMQIVIRNHGIIYIIIFWVIVIMSSCKTNYMVETRIVTIKNQCFRNAIYYMFSFADSNINCKYDLYYLIKGQKDNETECFILKSTSIPEIASKFGQAVLFTDTIDNHILLFPKNTIDVVELDGKEFPLLPRGDCKNNQGFKTNNDNVISFGGCESIEWLFLLSNNKIQVTDIKHYKVNMYDWLIYAKDTTCVDNPLLYQIDFIEEQPSDN